MVIEKSRSTDCLLREDCGEANGDADTEEPILSSVEYCSPELEQYPELTVSVCLSDGQRRYMKIKQGMDAILSLIGLAVLAVPILPDTILEKENRFPGIQDLLCQGNEPHGHSQNGKAD